MMEDMFQVIADMSFDEAMMATYEAGLSDDQAYEMDVVAEIQVLISQELKDMIPS